MRKSLTIAGAALAVALGLTACGDTTANTSTDTTVPGKFGSPPGNVEDRRTPITISPSLTAPTTSTTSDQFDVLADPQIQAGFELLSEQFGMIKDSLGTPDDATTAVYCTIQAGTAMSLQASVETYSGPVAVQVSNYLDEVILADTACVAYDWDGVAYHLELGLAIFETFA